MFNHVFNPKKRFLETRVFPSNDNDTFNDNKCSFCWGPYEDDHPAVRILPCNHVYGRDCLVEMVNSKDGDYCPKCRVPLFRPALQVAIARFLLSAITRILQGVLAAIIKYQAMHYKLKALKARLPAWLQFVIRYCGYFIDFYFDRLNPYYYAELITRRFTNLKSRNPNLDLRLVKLIWTAFILPVRLFNYLYDPKVDRAVYQVLLSAALVLLLTFRGAHGKIESRRDRCIFAIVMTAAFVLNFLSIAFKYSDAIFPHDAPADAKARRIFMAAAREKRVQIIAEKRQQWGL